MFSHLRGMYAFALWDSQAQRLLLAVDHIGMKPLYLTEHNGKLLFASEVKALFADPATPRELNLDVLDTYLSFGYMIGNESPAEQASVNAWRVARARFGVDVNALDGWSFGLEHRMEPMLALIDALEGLELARLDFEEARGAAAVHSASHDAHTTEVVP